jgi:hypothetical protein
MSEWNIQRAINTALSGVISVPVYDFVPQDTAYPYVTIGDDTNLPWDTFTETGLESTLTIHTWTRTRGRKDNKEIQGEVYGLLHRAELTYLGSGESLILNFATQSYSVDASYFVSCEFEYSDTVLDPDGHTYHGIQRFRVLLDYS